MDEIRQKDQHISEQYEDKDVAFHESTYLLSSKQQEERFIKEQFTTPEEMAKYRAYRKEWHRRSEQLTSGEQPLAVICELVSLCNLKCEMCYTITPEFQDTVVGSQRMMPWQTVTGIIDECARIGVSSLLLSWRGESTMYRVKDESGQTRDFADALAYARNRGVLEVTSLTNGRMFTPELIEKTVRAQPNWLSFSVDGLDRDYAKVRKQVKTDNGQDPFKLVMESIQAVIQLRDKLGQTRPQIRSNTIFPAIVKDPDGYRKFMEELGIGLVTINEILDYRGAELPVEAISENWFCQYPFQRLVVASNGTILCCPGAHNEESDVVLGRFPGSGVKRTKVDGREQVTEYPEISLYDAWHSPKIEKIRKLHADNKRCDIWACKHCRHGATTNGVTWIPEDWDREEMRWTKQKRFRNA
jgi:hypothetical protein